MNESMTAKEDFYHRFVLGLCAMLDNRYDITSNRESGNGRYDIQMKQYDKKLPGVIIEIKAEGACNREKLYSVAKRALVQIEEKKYDVDMIKYGIQHIFKFGVAFCGKDVEVLSE